jgi:transposase/transcriptional regulator with XRE-family HTH domain
MPRKSVPVGLTVEQLAQLDRWIKVGSTPQQVALRAKILRRAAEGFSDKEITHALKVHARTVALWRRRARREGIACVWEVAAGRGRKPTFGATTVSGWVDTTLQTRPKGASHWSTRALAKAVGVSKNTIHRVWQDHQLKPHLTKSFKLSRDPRFVEKLTDVVGLYLQPPKDAVVLCVDEKSQIQALDRTQPGLPLMRGRCGTFTHEYQRHGTTCLFAALHVGQGRVVAECYPRHRHQEFLRFLRRLETEFPPPRCLHLILDNYAIHGHERVRAWLRRRPRFVLHFIPTSSSWLNLIERWFAELEQKTVRRGAFRSVAELHLAIDEFLSTWNDDPLPYAWTASVERILAKVQRCRQRLEQIRPGCTTPPRTTRSLASG